MQDMKPMKVKMYCIFAKESVDKINGVRGKMCTQAGHAYLHSFWDATRLSVLNDFDMDLIQEKKMAQAVAYKNSDRAYKITLIVDTVEELVALQEKYKDICGTSLVTDAGFTVFNEPTTTCLGIGPISEENIGDDIKNLKVFI
jgi:peptidyl-tRNA hydrolase